MFGAPESVYVGMLQPNETILITLKLRAPLHAKAQDFILPYELRYSFKAHVIGSVITAKLRLK